MHKRKYVDFYFANLVKEKILIGSKAQKRNSAWPWPLPYKRTDFYKKQRGQT